MKAEVYLITNVDEIDQACSLGIKEPETQEELFLFCFNILDVSAMYKYSNTRMVLYITGQPFALKFNSKTWDEVVIHLTK